MASSSWVPWFIALGTAAVGCAPTPPEVDISSGATTTVESTGPGSGSIGTAGSGGSSGPGGSGGSEVGTSSSGMPGGTTVSVDGGATETGPGATSVLTTGDESPGTTDGDSGSTGGPSVCHPQIVEVLYDSNGGNNGEQWIKLYNPCGVPIDLANYSLGWGSTDYTDGSLDLSMMIAADDCFVVGGGNASQPPDPQPVYDLEQNLDPDLDDGDHNGNGDGVALFLGDAASVTGGTVPVDAVIYGEDNDGGLIDSMNATPPPHVGDAPENSSIRRNGPTDADWVIEPVPTPNVCPPY
ncbi:MAG: hypothetical protein AB1Z98_06625 [Nannocystaceae bacterium]